MKVLIACEFTGLIRDAFLSNGHDALSCDLEPTEVPGPHYQGDVFDVIDYPWDLLIGHPPCRDLSVSGAHKFEEKRMDGRQHAAVSFFVRLAELPIPRICLENPVSAIATIYRKPDQIIQPHEYGHGELKTTCLWLKGLPMLRPTDRVPGREQAVWKMGETKNRSRDRSRTYPGIAAAMADQWGPVEQPELDL